MKSVSEYFPFVVRETAVWAEVAVEVVETGTMLDPLVWVSAWDSNEPSLCDALVYLHSNALSTRARLPMDLALHFAVPR